MLFAIFSLRLQAVVAENILTLMPSKAISDATHGFGTGQTFGV